MITLIILIGVQCRLKLEGYFILLSLVNNIKQQSRKEIQAKYITFFRHVRQVIMFVNLNCDEKEKERFNKELKNLTYLTEKHQKEDFVVYGCFTNDVQGGDDSNNKLIAEKLANLGYLKSDKKGESLKFLQKVSIIGLNLLQMDVNGNEMNPLYRFLKRNSVLFVPKYGRS